MIDSGLLTKAAADQAQVWLGYGVSKDQIPALLREFDDLLTGIYDVSKAYDDKASERPGRWYYHLEEDALYRFVQMSPMETMKRVPVEVREDSPASRKWWGWERTGTRVSQDRDKPLMRVYYEDYHG